MATGQRNYKKLKTSPLKIALLLVQIILIKIGQIPILIAQNVIASSKGAWRSPKKIASSLPLLAMTKGINPRKRGRPRNTWFLPYYLTKWRLYFKKRVSGKTKFSLAALFILTLLYLYTSFIFTAAYQLPSPTRLTSADKALTTEFFDRNGKLLYRMYEGRNRILVSLRELPPYLIQATLAAEDKNFYHHPGIDPIAILRALYANFKNQSLEGASTITQQLIKNTLLTPEKTYSRKIKEIILALWAERIYSKDEILQMYLNEAPYGGPAWGVEAASQTYFGKSARNLTLAQASFLAGLPASPTQFSPYGTNPELSKIRQKAVLNSMVENKFINQSQADLAYAEDLHLQPATNNIKAPHFVMYVKDLLAQKFGQRVVSQGGLKITTTLDLGLQQQVEKIVSEQTPPLTSLNIKNAAVLVTDGPTGQILAMLGSKDYHEQNFGAFNVTTALRQPGSSIKVATYAAAFKLGFSPGNTILDVPVRFADEWGNSYSPQNYDGKYHGPVSIRTALGSSYNIPAVKMLSTVGVEEMAQTAKDLGITTFNDPKRFGLSLTLGGGEVKMIDMMTLYGALSQLGSKRVATPILKVTDSNGNVLEEYENHSTRAITPEVAYLVTDILIDNKARTPAFGSNSLLNIPGKTVAVKTGTSDNKRDNWTFGYTPQFVVGVWVGNNDNTPMNQQLTSGVSGAAPIWNKIMQSLLEGKENQAFTRPAGVIEARVDGRKDLTIASILPKSLVRIAKKEDKFIFSDPYSSYATPSAQAGIEGTTN